MMGMVPSFSHGSTVSAALPGYIALFLALQTPRLVSAQFRVIGPEHPISASVGGEAELSCHLFPKTSAENMEVRWSRSQSSMVVHLYRDGKEQAGEQMPEYQNRTELLKDDIANGRVSLRIRNIRPSDDGQYKCLFHSGVSSGEASFNLQVAALGSAPAISVKEGHRYSEIRVVCQSSGWYPSPEVQWRDSQGRLLSSVSENISPEASGLFQTVAAVVLTEESNQKVSCHVRNTRLNQERESEISVSGPLFQSVSLSRCVLVGGLSFLSVLAAVIVLAVVIFWRWKRATGKRQTSDVYEVCQDENSKLQTTKILERLQDEKNQLQDEIKKLQTNRWRIAKIFAVDVTLDPDTANPNLILSEDWKRVSYRGKRQGLPDNPESFHPSLFAMGAEGFTCGRRYWEVEVGDSSGWTLGVCRESVSRKESVTLSPGNGHWAVWLKDGEYKALTSPRTPLLVSVRPSQVGIFLDYKLGELSFYNVTDRSLLFTFNDTFSGTLRPYFSPCLDAKNQAPLIICPIPGQAGENICL